MYVREHHCTEGKRDYNKIDCCYYCKRFYKSKISKHYSNIHRDEKIVKKLLRMESKERIIQLYRLTQLGNFQYNCEVSIFYLRITKSDFSLVLQMLCSNGFTIFSVNRTYSNLLIFPRVYFTRIATKIVGYKLLQKICFG